MSIQCSKSEKKEILGRIKQTVDVDEILKYTNYQDNDIRLKAVSELCPCKVQEDNKEFWDRVFQMVDDPDAKIRARILHIICDGSPDRLELQVAEALERFNRDTDRDIKRQAHKVLASYTRTGKWNIL
ncbi:hypothetical protein TTHERM_000729209 (macronuclear) [Tetrahymena thermophila SB210]|uniref:HEAT repeat domain-containing protein n=1 Tax=Tetrahymena thermophila (strain SB210) TaxID=312017 RepID=W7X8E3_TETTS|nr:hypothetical protein TTHERM_000729209 [Tetrahymena thermophila SB210]EWS72678.1 hypothetical protein TTHERM_000729209 [Tetrahymena thermophila SB210]|eukprot:XP_012654803.1 hypothetical protein TTHERM_000729209 [Tetrahymena thermophila SB210]